MWNIFESKNILRISIVVSICFFDLSTSRPAEEPTKFSLNTVNESSAKTQTLETTKWDQGRELIGRIADAIRLSTGRFINSVTLLRNIIANRAETLTSESQNVVSVVAADTKPLDSIQYPPVINTRPTARETVRLEKESEQSLLERPKSNPASGILESFLKPTPLVDSIREEEKYGNSGDKFIGIGRALVSGFEGFSNFLNAIVDLPRNAIKNTSRGITEALNNVGARLIGLQ